MKRTLAHSGELEPEAEHDRAPRQLGTCMSGTKPVHCPARVHNDPESALSINCWVTNKFSD